MGKSALVAYVLYIIKQNPLRRDKKQDLLLYYFHSNDARCTTGNFLEACINKIKDLMG